MEARRSLQRAQDVETISSYRIAVAEEAALTARKQAETLLAALDRWRSQGAIVGGPRHDGGGASVGGGDGDHGDRRGSGSGSDAMLRNLDLVVENSQLGRTVADLRRDTLDVRLQLVAARHRIAELEMGVQKPFVEVPTTLWPTLTSPSVGGTAPSPSGAGSSSPASSAQVSAQPSAVLSPQAHGVSPSSRLGGPSPPRSRRSSSLRSVHEDGRAAGIVAGASRRSLDLASGTVGVGVVDESNSELDSLRRTTADLIHRNATLEVRDVRLLGVHPCPSVPRDFMQRLAAGASQYCDVQCGGVVCAAVVTGGGA